MDKNNLKAEYKKIYKKIQIIFNKYDLINIKSDYSDEYNYEISKILARLNNIKSLNDIHELIIEEFSKSFSINKSEFHNNEIVKNISKEIWKAWQESNLNKEKP